MEHLFGFMLNDISRMMRSRFDSQAKKWGLNRSQWRVLVYLARGEGINQSGLAETIEVDRMTIGRMLDRLEASGWVERRPDVSDRRVHRLYLTRKARPLLDKMIVVANEVQEEALAGLNVADRERLHGLLAVILDNMSALQAANDPDPVDVPRAERRGGDDD
jgi:DNA-binding MarR family transcriptional regulator